VADHELRGGPSSGYHCKCGRFKDPTRSVSRARVMYHIGQIDRATRKCPRCKGKGRI
jgi:hypothetical protein